MGVEWVWRACEVCVVCGLWFTGCVVWYGCGVVCGLLVCGLWLRGLWSGLWSGCVSGLLVCGLVYGCVVYGLVYGLVYWFVVWCVFYGCVVCGLLVCGQWYECGTGMVAWFVVCGMWRIYWAAFVDASVGCVTEDCVTDSYARQQRVRYVKSFISES